MTTSLGRPPLGAELVNQIDGSDQAKRKLRVILQTLAGEKTVPEACEELGVNRSRFHALRQEFLLDAVASLEPRNRGRPARQVNPEEVHVAELEHRVEALTVELRAAQVREELAAVMPHLFKHPPATPKTPGAPGAPVKYKSRKGRGAKKK